MPGMNGGATYRRIRSMNPGVKVLLWSGYHSDEEVASLLKQGCVGFVQKPVDIVSLSKTISGILGKREMPGGLSEKNEEP
jgi:DNA-binding NarL/FixJ family response regulator